MSKLQRFVEMNAAIGQAMTQPTPAPSVSALARMAQIKAQAVANPDTREYAEIRRITQLPIITPMDERELEEFNRLHVMAEQFDSGWRLFVTQAEGLAAYEMYGGLCGTIGVGWGKTLLCLGIGNYANSKGIKRWMHFLPANALSQLLDTDIAYTRSKIGINYPINVLGGKDAKMRKALAESGRRGAYLMPFSQLSAKDASAILEAVKPELLIIDEAHNVARQNSARGRRVFSYISRHQPEVVAVSGSMTKKSIMDYAATIKAALRDNCPLPLADSMTREWSVLIDAQASTVEGQPTANSTGPILPLVEWAEKNFPDKPGGFPQNVFGFRSAYQARLNSAPGVVGAGDAEIATSLTLHNHAVQNYEAAEGWKELKFFIDQVNDLWLTPNGDEIEHAIHTWKWLNELCGAGFYNQLTWPVKEEYAKRKNITELQAEEILQRAVIHHQAGQEYAKALRKWIEAKSRPGLDTPFLIGRDMALNKEANVGGDLYQLWVEHKMLDFEGRPERDNTAVRVCPFKIDACANWVVVEREQDPNVGMIIWYYHNAVGIWAAEEIRKRNVGTVLFCPAGEASNVSIRDAANAGKIAVASIKAHGTAKNLQHFFKQYCIQWPRDCGDAEQLLGRCHRNGQLADELIVNTNQTLIFDQLNFAACLNDALYVHQTTKNRQKLIYAAYDPLPKIFPPAVLRQKGLDATMLNDQESRALREKFGEFSKV